MGQDFLIVDDVGARRREEQAAVCPDRPDYAREGYTIMKGVNEPVMIVRAAKGRESLRIIEEIAENDSAVFRLSFGDPEGNVGGRIAVRAGHDD